MNEDIFVPGAFFLTIIVLGLGIPLVRAHIRRMDRAAVTPSVPSDLGARLDRIEAMVESVAVEVERLSEGQRFTTKLLADRAAPSVVPAVPASARAHNSEVTHA